VEREALGGEASEDRGRLGGALPAADGADADERLGGEVDAGALVQLAAAKVVVERVALEDGHDELRRVPQLEQEALDRELLMLAHRLRVFSSICGSHIQSWGAAHSRPPISPA
jgi:hypothetical protein